MVVASFQMMIDPYFKNGALKTYEKVMAKDFQGTG